MLLVYHAIDYDGSVSTALALSAGGMFAAWEVGVWKVLEQGFRPDIVVGASAGSWLGWSIAGGATAADLEREWLDPLTAEIMRPGLHWTGCLRPDALHAKARDLFERYTPRVPFGLTLVEMPSLRLRLVRGPEITWRHLAAACSVPLGFPPVEIDGRRYVDGGLRSSLPLWAAEELGASEAIALNCLTTFPFRALRTIFRPRRPSPRLAVTLIEPSRPLGSVRDAIFWNSATIEGWIAQGVEDGKNALSSVRM
jgi:NTE family protein